MQHKTEMITILAAFIVLGIYLWYKSARKKSVTE